jgi:hypothetical protein
MMFVGTITFYRSFKALSHMCKIGFIVLDLWLHILCLFPLSLYLSISLKSYCKIVKKSKFPS